MSSLPFIAVALTGLACLIALQDWRKGVYAVLVFGVLQDPFRKLTPGFPAYYLLWAAGLFGVVSLAAYHRRAMARFSQLYLYDSSVRGAWSFFLGVVLLQAVHALVRWQNPAFPILGLLFYMGPIAALLVAIGYSRSFAWIERFMLVYSAITLPAALTVYLSGRYGDTWPVLKEIGELAGKKLLIYDMGTVLESYSGLYRVGEIAAWHAATCASFLVIWVSRNRSLALRLAVAGAVVLLIGAIVLTGRRKMLMTLTIFVSVQLTLLLLFHGRSAKQALTLMVVGLIGSFGLSLLDPASETGLYMQRGTSVFEDALGRLQTAINLLRSALYRGSGIGLGAGVSAQGAQHVGDIASAVGGSAESGLGKLMVELGMPGMLAVVWLALMLTRRFLWCLRVLVRVDETLFFYTVSFAAMLVANLATFFVATQVYGDFFILIILGFIAGFVFALIHAGLRGEAKRRRRAFQAARSGPVAPPAR